MAVSESLTTQAREAIAKAEALASRDRALAELLELMPDTGSLWSLSGDISARLRRIKATAWPRIAAGYREPRDAMERALVAILNAGGPCSRRRLYWVLQELPHPGTKSSLDSA